MRLVAPLLAVVVSAVAYGLCFPVAAVRSLAWVALVPFFVAIRRGGLARACFLAWAWTVVAAYAVGDWFATSVSTYYQQPAAVGIGFFAGVSSVMAAPYVVAFTLCYRALARRPRATLALFVAAAWVVAEWGRANLLTGNPWALFGYALSSIGILAQIADVTGVYGVSFVLVAINAALAETWLAVRAGDRSWRRQIRGLRLAGLALGLVVGYGMMRLGTAPALASHPSSTKVAVIQGNLDLGSQWREEFYGRNLEAYMRLTLAALRAERPQMVLWPESSMTFFLEKEPLYRATLARMLASSGARLIAGAPHFVGPRENPRYYNSAFLLSPKGGILGRYDKQRLLPFAEYFPIPGLDLLRRRFARVREFTPGVSRALLPTPAGPAGIVICNEGVFPEIAAARARAGAAYLVNLANDTWVSHAKFSKQLFNMVSLRAVEQRRYLVRASTAGYSAIVDPWGRALEITEPFTQSWIAGSIEPRYLITPYCRFGDAFVLACCVALATALIADRLRGSVRAVA